MSKTDPYAAPSRIYARTEPIAPVEDVRVEETGTEVPSGTISEITEWVGDDKERAQVALDAENAKDKPRVTLVEYLEDKVTS